VQRAARICQDAAPETIVVSAAVRDELAGRFDLTEIGAYRLKGFAASVPLYSVAWA
jgi:class 3 adenylate cyclase